MKGERDAETQKTGTLVNNERPANSFMHRKIFLINIAMNSMQGVPVYIKQMKEEKSMMLVDCNIIRHIAVVSFVIFIVCYV